MMTEILAWCVLGVFWVFVIGPMLDGFGYNREKGYWDSVLIVGVGVPIVLGSLSGLIFVFLWAVKTIIT